MSRRDVIVPAKLLLQHGIFSWPALKLQSLDFAYKNTKSVYEGAFSSPISKEDIKGLKELIKLEIVITTIHYAEVLASYLLSFEKGNKAIQRSLFSYRVIDVNNFYKSIKTKRMSYIAKLFSYPQPHQVRPASMSKKISNSCTKIKKDLSEIGNYYLEHLDLYNSYKHGLRVGLLTSTGHDPKKNENVITYFIPDKPYYPAKVILTRFDHKRAKKITYKMTALLNNASQLYLDRVIEKKDKMNARLY